MVVGEVELAGSQPWVGVVGPGGGCWFHNEPTTSTNTPRLSRLHQPPAPNSWGSVHWFRWGDHVTRSCGSAIWVEVTDAVCVDKVSRARPRWASRNLVGRYNLSARSPLAEDARVQSL